MTIMLAEKDEHGFVKHMGVAIRTLVRALAFVMHNRRRHIVVLIALLDEAVGQINVFAIHKEGFIKTAAFLNRPARRQHESPRQNLYRIGLLLVQITLVITTKGLRLWEQRRQTAHLAERNPRCRQSAARL